MPKSGLKHIDVGADLSKTEWESEDSHELIHGTSFPGSPVERQLFYRDDEHKWYIYDGTAWVWLGGSGGGMEIHGNEYHDPDFATESALSSHAAAATGVHGVGGGTVAKISTAAKTIYLDKDATGNNDGTSWADAFESWADCKAFLTGYTIAHAWVIKVRKATTPYREIFQLDGLTVWGTLRIEAEYYWQGDCEANVGGAGEITDTGAFADVAIGDRVLVMDFNGTSGKAQDYELCTVDNISNIPNRIGTTGTKTPTTGWKYTIVRTEISGSDNGTDGGTARNYCVYGVSVDNVSIYGFKMTFSDSWAALVFNSRQWNIVDCIVEDCDLGVAGGNLSVLSLRYSYVHATVSITVQADDSTVDCRYCAIKATTEALRTVHGYITTLYVYVFQGSRGVSSERIGMVVFWYSTITNGVTTGLYARDSVIQTYTITNNAGTPIDPTGTTEGAHIFEGV